LLTQYCGTFGKKGTSASLKMSLSTASFPLSSNVFCNIGTLLV